MPMLRANEITCGIARRIMKPAHNVAQKVVRVVTCVSTPQISREVAVRKCLAVAGNGESHDAEGSGSLLRASPAAVIGRK